MIIKIECDRRIKKLNIEFGDGGEDEIEFTEEFTSEVKPRKKKSEQPPKQEKFLSTDDEILPQVNQEVIEIPVIEEKERAPLVSGDMQNLEF